MSELLPCPFCATPYICTDASSLVGVEGNWYEISCPDCGAAIGCDSLAEATERWNRRATVASNAAEGGAVWMPDSIKDDVGLCAAAVVLAYHRKTHEHILADDDAFKAALRVEKYLGRR